MSKEAWKKLKADILERLRGSPELIYGSVKKQKPLPNGWVQGLCPFHNDTHPSFGFNRQTLAWCCFVCGKGSAFDFLMASSGMDFKHTLLHWCDKLGIPLPEEARPAKAQPPIPERLIERWQENLWKNEEIVRWLREKRGLNDDILRKRQIGWDPKRERNTIPIRDEHGRIGNVRLYNAKKSPKIINYTEGSWRYGSPARLYGVEHLVKDDGRPALLLEGEWDKLVGEQEGFLTVTSTHGCSVFRPEWVEHFAGRDVVVVYDCDAEGQRAAREIILKAFRPAVTSGKVKSIRNVVLPLRGTKDDKDVTDYFVKRGFTAADLRKLIDGTAPHSYEDLVAPEEVIELGSFVEVERKDLIDRKVSCEITVCGETSEAFHAVEEFEVTYCPRKLKGQCYDCADAVKVPRGAREYIGSCMATDVQVTAMLRAFCCRYGQKPGIKILKRTTVKEFFCHQRVRRLAQINDGKGNVTQFLDGKQQELLEKRVYYLSSEHPRPGSYGAVGWVKSHPRTQQVTFLIESMEPQEDDYERFRVEENADELRALRSVPFDELVADLRENVTKIYERDDILAAILLTYCSPRWLRFNGRLIRGWLVTVILGDAGTGKTQTYQAIAEHIGVGDTVSGLTASRTGLAYALVEHKQKGWQVRIGRYPANSRKILAVDEVQFIREWDLRTLSKGMEEGFLQIDRVQSKGYESQTRLILIANPKRDGVMDGFSFGCDALQTVFPPTIIRRTDIVVFANYGDIRDLSFINKRSPGKARPALAPEALRALVFWAWNLGPEQIEFANNATDLCLAKAVELSERYGYATRIPLVTISDARNKLARIAAAFAVLSVSSDEGFSKLFVRPEHVHAAVMFLDELYGAENCQLGERSEIAKRESQVLDYEDIERAFLEKQSHEKHATGEEGGHFTAIVRTLRSKDVVRRDHLAELVGCQPEAVTRAVRLLKKFSLIDSSRDGYTKTPKLNKFLRRFVKVHPGFLDREAPGNG